MYNYFSHQDIVTILETELQGAVKLFLETARQSSDIIPDNQVDEEFFRTSCRV